MQILCEAWIEWKSASCSSIDKNLLLVTDEWVRITMAVSRWQDHQRVPSTFWLTFFVEYVAVKRNLCTLENYWPAFDVMIKIWNKSAQIMVQLCFGKHGDVANLDFLLRNAAIFSPVHQLLLKKIFHADFTDVSDFCVFTRTFQTRNNHLKLIEVSRNWIKIQWLHWGFSQTHKFSNPSEDWI